MSEKNKILRDDERIALDEKKREITEMILSLSEEQLEQLAEFVELMKREKGDSWLNAY